MLSVILSSCGSRQDIVYFQNIDNLGSSKSIINYNPLIRPDDQLTIIVTALDQDLARPFNLPAISFVGANGDIGRSTQQTYLVDADGNIEFPVLGQLKLAGKTRAEATTMIRELTNEYVKNPIVNLRIVNFKVTVIGEVSNPGVFTITNERITILEALGLAGDLTIQASRNNIKVIREIDGKKTPYTVNLTSADIFSSPVYYLTQNDVIYVEPNNSRIKSSSVGPNTATTLGVVSTLVTVVALIISITR
tara:strand:+ start:530053 stop:530799 length:747 start_codon:yes stop_codon:yes gene_type:complete